MDKSDRFVFKPLLYELLTGAADADEVSPKFSDLLEPTSVQFVCQRVERVEHEADASPGPGSRAGCVVLSDGSEIDYDWIVLALGADITPRGTPGAKEHAIPFATLEDVERAIAELDSIKVGQLPVRELDSTASRWVTPHRPFAT